MTQQASFILKTAIIATVAGIGAYLWWKKKQHSSKTSECTNSDVGTQKAFSAFLPYAENFSGLYEPLYKCCYKPVSRERMLNTLKEWDIRMGNLTHISILYEWWKDYGTDIMMCSDSELKERLNGLLSFITKGGIIRDNHKVVTVNDNTVLYYMTIDNDPLPKGKEVIVDSPCWYMDFTPPRILEKGYCIIK